MNGLITNLLPKQSLGVKVIVSIIIVSSFVTLIATGIQLYIEYKRDINLLHDRVAQIESGYLRSITNSLWAVDKEQLNLLLEGIYHLPDIQRAEILVDEYPYIGVGEIPLKHMKQYSFSLTYEYDKKLTNLGSLNVYISLQGIYQRLIDRIAVILGSQAVKTFIVSIFALLIFHYFVTRHLNTIFKAVSDMRNKSEYGGISLQRKQLKGATDEFDNITIAFNQLISNLKESYNALQKSEERFDLAMQGSNDALWDWSVDNKEIYFSDRYKEILGIHNNQFAGNFAEWSNRIHPDDRRETLANLGRALRGEIEQFNHRYRLRHQNNSYRWVLGRGIVVKSSDKKPVRMVGTIMDITKHKQAEEQLATTLRKLEAEHSKRIIAERLACVGELSASIAHEIRNPLCSIIGAVEHMNDDTLSKDDHNEMCNILHRETKRLDRVLTDFLQFSRQREPELTAVNINKLLHDVVQAIQLDYSVGHIVINEIYDHSIHEVLCDSDLIRQVLWNLLKNSVQSITDNGVITATTTYVDEKCLVSIKDNGMGIDSEYKENIIEPFVTHRRKGTGLGLAISNKILASHQSELIIDSVHNEGTDAKFMLKIA